MQTAVSSAAIPQVSSNSSLLSHSISSLSVVLSNPDPPSNSSNSSLDLPQSSLSTSSLSITSLMSSSSTSVSSSAAPEHSSVSPRLTSSQATSTTSSASIKSSSQPNPSTFHSLAQSVSSSIHEPAVSTTNAPPSSASSRATKSAASKSASSSIPKSTAESETNSKSKSAARSDVPAAAALTDLSTSSSNTLTVHSPQISGSPSGTLDNQNAISHPSFWSNKAMSVSVIIVVCLAAIALIAFVITRARRKREARRRRYAAAIYTNSMAQRRSFYNDFTPSFEEIPRPPPVPPRRRPVPRFNSNPTPPDSDLVNLTGVGAYGARRSSQSQFDPNNPFNDTITMPVPLLTRPLRSSHYESSEPSGNSHDGHEGSLIAFSATSHSNEPLLEPPPSPTPSAPSLYPPTLAPDDDKFYAYKTQ